MNIQKRIENLEIRLITTRGQWTRASMLEELAALRRAQAWNKEEQ